MVGEAENTIAATSEVRFAVVLYGGVSLAIYINGVVQELLHLVHATASDGEGNLRATDPAAPVEEVYRELGRRRRGKEFFDGVEVTSPVSTRFVVDTIAGTSAGGINGVFLAKALACDLPLTSLTDLWVREGAIELLINDADSERDLKIHNERPPRSLLSSQRMSYEILTAISEMSTLKADAQPAPSPYADAIDLFITATDLAGRVDEIPLDDHSGGRVRERVHRAVFHFVYGTPSAIGLEAVNHFTAEYDLMLSFAARATSSFPAAFEPMCLDDIRSAAAAMSNGERPGPQVLVPFRPFFRRYPESGYTAVYFADGGDLDNKPFSPILEALPHRRADIPVDRKLLYVEPDPGLPTADDGPAVRPSIVENLAAVVTAPRVENIAGEVEAIREFGRLSRSKQEQYDIVSKALDRALAGIDVRGSGQEELRATVSVLTGATPAATAAATVLSHRDDVVERIASGSPTHEAYLAFRESRTASDVAEALARIVYTQVYDPGSPVHLALVEAVRAWLAGPAGLSRKEFLRRFDLRFRLDRINFIQAGIRRSMQSVDDQVSFEERRRIRGALDGVYVLLRGGGRRLRTPSPDHPAHEELGRLRQWFGAEPRKDVTPVGILGDQIAMAAFGAVLAKLADCLALEGSVEQEWSGIGGDNDLVKRWVLFEFYDEAAGTLRDALGGENDPIEVHRVSPIDATAISGERSQGKLAGSAIHHFGGFFLEDWRRNDILWGRLDGAERIIEAIVPIPDDEGAASAKECRTVLVGRAHKAILRELLDDPMWGPWLRARLPAGTAADKEVPALLAALKARPRVPTEPEPGDMLKLAVRAGKTTSQVLAGLQRERPGLPGVQLVSRGLRLGSNILEFLVPGRWRNLILKRALVVTLLASVLMTFGGAFLGLHQVRNFGIGVLVASLTLRLVADAAVAQIELKRPKLGWVTRVAVTLVVAAVASSVNSLVRRGRWTGFLIGLMPSLVILAVALLLRRSIRRDEATLGHKRPDRLLLLARVELAALTLTFVVYDVVHWAQVRHDAYLGWRALRSWIGG